MNSARYAAIRLAWLTLILVRLAALPAARTVCLGMPPMASDLRIGRDLGAPFPGVATGYDRGEERRSSSSVMV